MYTNVYTDVNGCDSTVTLDLTINNSSSSTVTITACDSFDWDGVTYDSTGTYTNVYNDLWLKRYTTALMKKQWGQNLSKFSGIALPGGVTLDGQQLKQEAQEEITRLEEESRLNHDMLPMDMIG